MLKKFYLTTKYTRDAQSAQCQNIIFLFFELIASCAIWPGFISLPKLTLIWNQWMLNRHGISYLFKYL